jgi:hypothetical protein
MCETIRLSDGGTMIVCSRGSHKRGKGRRCVRCSATAVYVCDAPGDPLVGTWDDEEGQGRCSAPLCPAHAFTIEGRHYCFPHRPAGSDVVQRAEKVKLVRR